MTKNGKDKSMNEEDCTIGKAMQDAGYLTLMIGT